MKLSGALNDFSMVMLPIEIFVSLFFFSFDDFLSFLSKYSY
jgi:hypothetical protein